MLSCRLLTCPLAFVSALGIAAGQGLTSKQLKMLQDPAGWEYIRISDPDDGIPTQHTCFDGVPHPQQCSGVMSFAPDNTFTQRIYIHGQTVQRHGTYQLDGSELAFFDELGTKDGPYTLGFNAQKKRLVLEMPQVRIELELEKQYRKDRQEHKQPPH
jgi:hypothetical protein